MLKNTNYIQIPNRFGRYIVLDTETTGLFCESNHIIEIAAIEIQNGYLTGNQFHAFLKPRKKIDSKAEEKHKMNNNFYKENYDNAYESDKIIMQNLLNFVGDCIIFAHNASFDMQFLNYELTYWNLPEIRIENFRCTMRIFKNLFENCRFKHTKGNTLSGCCQFFNIKFDDKDLHSACYDAMLTAKLINSIYEFLNKNPDYLTKKIVCNYAYLLTKRDLYGKKPGYSFLTNNSNAQNSNNLNYNNNQIINENNHNNSGFQNNYSNFNTSVPKEIKNGTNINNRYEFKNNEEQILLSADKNHFRVTNTNGVISAKKVNQNNEMELLVYDTNKEVNKINSAVENGTQNHNTDRLNLPSKKNSIDLNNNFNNGHEDRKHVDEKEINYIQKIYGDNKANNQMSTRNNLNKNINFININELSKIENKSYYSHYQLNNASDKTILNEISLVNKHVKSNPNKIYNNSQIKVSEFQIENLNLIMDPNHSSKNINFGFQINERKSGNIKKVQNNIEEIGNYIEHNADEVYNLVKDLNEDEHMEIEIIEDEKSETTNNFDLYQNKNFDEIKKNFTLIDERINNNESRDVFNISKNSHLLRSKVLIDKSNKFYNDEIESKKPRLNKMMKNFLDENNSYNVKP